MKLELISFKICPFVQRSVITLRHKGLPYEVTYIELDDPPPWFLEISPFGRVPALRVDDTTVLFESAIINEYIDDVTPGSLKSDDPLIRAKDRGWIQFGEQCIFDLHNVMVADDEAAFEQALAQALGNLRKVEAILGDGPYFNGASLSLVDCAYAPLWMRYAILNRRHRLFEREDLPKIAAWSETLLAMDAVRGSVVEDFESLLAAYIAKKGAYAKTVFT